MGGGQQTVTQLEKRSCNRDWGILDSCLTQLCYRDSKSGWEGLTNRELVKGWCIRYGVILDS